MTTLEAKLEGLQTSSSKDSSALADLKTKHEALGATHNQLQVQVKELEQTIETLRTENQNLASEREAATTSQGETNTALEGSRKELKEGLINPAMDMLGMVTLALLRPLRRVWIVRALIGTVSADLQTRRHPGRSPLADAQ